MLHKYASITTVVSISDNVHKGCPLELLLEQEESGIVWVLASQSRTSYWYMVGSLGMITRDALLGEDVMIHANGKGTVNRVVNFIEFETLYDSDDVGRISLRYVANREGFEKGLASRAYSLVSTY